MRCGLTFVLLLPACVSTGPVESLADRRGRAQDLYDEGDFERSMRQFSEILRDHPDDYEAILGLGSACREVGNARYFDANRLSAAGRSDGALVCLTEARESHIAALEWFARAKAERPNDGRSYRGAGLVYYGRASGAYRLLTEDEDADVLRCAEFAVLELEAARARMAERPELRRCLGLMLVAAGRFDEAPEHLERYADSLEERRQAVAAWDPPPHLRGEREAELAAMDSEIAALQETLELCRERAGQEAGPPVNGVTNASFRLLVARDASAPSAWPGR